jgi:2-polyprenyl-3-methyl-5-hydroxy-6-metoxy-1,4-benzoquinol methylase
MTDTITSTTTPDTTAPDPALIEAFGEQLLGAYVGAATTAMVAIGHKTGLFEAATAGPATSSELADRAGLSERHVREWLGSMVTAGVFTYDPTDASYRLPPEHAFLLTGDTTMNQAVLAPMSVHLSTHVNDVAERFRSGGGVPYDEYRPEFTEAMDEIGRRQYDASLIGSYLPRADGLTDRLEQGIAVADLGCGTGHCINLMARQFPASTFVGYDIADDALDLARAEAKGWGLTNVRFDLKDVAGLNDTEQFGLVTAFDAIHDQVDPDGMLAGAYAALEPGGTFFAVDIKASSNLEDNVGNPLAPYIYAVSVLHCMEVSLAGEGAGLGTAWGRELACQMLGEAGFEGIEVHDMDDDPLNVIYTCRRPVSP